MDEAQRTVRFSRGDVRAAFARATIERGRTYVWSGAVAGIAESDDGYAFTASVQGSRDAPYIVQLWIVRGDDAPRRIIGYCSCPVGRNCKHAAATLLAMLEPRFATPADAPLALTPASAAFERAAPVPALRLRTIAQPARALFGEAETIDVAEFTLVYGGHAVDPDAPALQLRVVDLDRTIVYPRSRSVEAAAYARLHRFGFYADAGTRRQVPSVGALLRMHDGGVGWPAFIHRGLSELRADGWEIVVDPTFRKAVVDVTDESAWHASVADAANGWFDLAIGVDVEGRRVDLLALLRDLMSRGVLTDAARAAPASDEPVYVSLERDLTVALPAARLRAIVATLVELGDAHSPTTDTGLRLPRARLGELGMLEARSGLRPTMPDDLRALAERLRGTRGLERVEVPNGLRCALRSYQRDGLDWLQFLRSFGCGGVLADDMGLGKTVQTIAHIVVEKEAGRLMHPALLIVPTSLVFNWCDELARFAPSLDVVVLHGSERARRHERLAGCDVAITTYALLSRDAVFREASWHLVVFDEAQFMKNPTTRAARIATTLNAAQRIALTGTPVENHLGDLWSIFAITLPGLLGQRAHFTREFRTPIEKRADETRRAQLAERVRPFLLRRTKASVAADLPEKVEIVRRVELRGAQRDLYETVRVAMRDRVLGEIGRSGIARSRIIILDALLKLRQVCCDPRLLPERFGSTAASSKLEHLSDMLPAMVAEGRRILVFSQFTRMLDLIGAMLDEHGIAYALLTGETTDRAGSVKRFERGDVPVFLISLRAGGTGLNLVAADTVIHYDPWWNPAVERQATDRAHRIGQRQRVFVYRLIGADTVEEKIVELQTHKARVAAGIYTTDPAGDAPFSKEDIERLFEPLRRP